MTSQRDPEGIETQHLLALGDLANAHVLEIGCGEGRLTWRYAHHATHVVGFDLDAVRLTTAQQDCPPHLRPKVAFLQADSLALPFPADTFDRAILAWSL
jgi:ubiquinone/menaquinone biosynthesis C-methylase UbiE